MFKKISILILIPIFCFSCGYTPMYSKNANKQFKIELLDFEGDREISKNLKFNLEKNNYPDANQKVVISAITNYTKSSETKNLEGNIEYYVWAGNPNDAETILHEDLIINLYMIILQLSKECWEKI